MSIVKLSGTADSLQTDAQYDVSILDICATVSEQRGPEDVVSM